MTRRVRFSPWALAGAIATAGALAPARAHAAEVPFVAQPAFGKGLGAFDPVAGDIDGDGDVDLVPLVGVDRNVWLENAAGDGSAWVERVIVEEPDVSLRAATLADVDGDGDRDVVAGLFGALRWYENLGGGSAWATHTIATGLFYSLEAADIDGDGAADVLVSLAGPDEFGWYENSGNGSSWTLHTIDSGTGSGMAAVPADVDGDGDQDAIGTVFEGPYSQSLFWYENAGGGSSWTRHTIGTGAFHAPVAAADVDRDGDLDVLASEPGAVTWHENVAGNGSAWAVHVVATQVGGATTVRAADVDGDGDTDVLSATYINARSAWHENLGGGSAFATHTLATQEYGSLTLRTADLDGDGDVDLVSSQQVDETVSWWRNETIHRSACFASPVTVTTAATRPYSLSPADVDGDGDVDVVSGEEVRIAWYENAGLGLAWLPHTVGTAGDVFRTAFAADVDGDGDQDVLGGARFTGRVVWFENADGQGTAWIERTIATGAADLWFVRAGDVDGDGDLDALSASRYDDTVAWYENTAGNGTAWTKRVVSTASARPYTVMAADVDGDGDEDVLSSALDGKVAWHENLAGTGTSFALHTIATANSPHGLVVGDVDGDGDLDALVNSATGATRVWHENLTGAGASWAPHTISVVQDSPRALAAADFDADGDLDALSSALIDGRVDWHENVDGAGVTWTTRTVALVPGVSVHSVAAADVDGDGRTDALYDELVPGRVSWRPNRGGQFGLAATDTAPATANNGDLVAMLRIAATHLGRAGDHDLELASLGLLFEKAPGEPLTTAEANALVESLRIYRDADGNGVLDPETDVLVVGVPALTLVSGVQTVAFADGDANVQVAFGSGRTYFVAVELTADASQQSPNQFRVTHLGQGASASRAEDRDFDLALQAACPADVSSSLRQVVPVALTGFTVE